MIEERKGIIMTIDPVSLQQAYQTLQESDRPGDIAAAKKVFERAGVDFKVGTLVTSGRTINLLTSEGHPFVVTPCEIAGVALAHLGLDDLVKADAAVVVAPCETPGVAHLDDWVKAATKEVEALEKELTTYQAGRGEASRLLRSCEYDLQGDFCLTLLQENLQVTYGIDVSDFPETADSTELLGYITEALKRKNPARVGTFAEKMTLAMNNLVFRFNRLFDRLAAWLVDLTISDRPAFTKELKALRADFKRYQRFFKASDTLNADQFPAIAKLIDRAVGILDRLRKSVHVTDLRLETSEALSELTRVVATLEVTRTEEPFVNGTYGVKHLLSLRLKS